MSTKRKITNSTSKTGINWIKSLIEKNNDIFQEIDLENDVGNDAYIEFVINEETTGCCIASQIKTGKSYINAKGEYFFQSDKEHFEYWSSHLLPICGLVHTPEQFGQPADLHPDTLPELIRTASRFIFGQF